MKRVWKWLLAAILLAAAVAAAWLILTPEAIQESKESAVEECNRESEFLLDLTLPAGQITGAEEMEETHAINGPAYFLSGDGISYTIAGYPNVLGPYHVTGISITSDACAVYGIRVGDTLEDAAAILSEWGYVLERSFPCEKIYRKYDVTIDLSVDEHEKVYSICVRVDVIDETLVDF